MVGYVNSVNNQIVLTALITYSIFEQIVFQKNQRSINLLKTAEGCRDEKYGSLRPRRALR